MDGQRVIMLIDMDAYFASVEQQCNPFLRGKPVGVIGSARRTVITTSSYEARAFGVKTGMSIYEAKKLCPSLILVVGNNHKYTYTCKKLSEIYRRYAPVVEIYSVDEAFIDLTQTRHLWATPCEIGKKIKNEIKQSYGINATVGISHNKLMAKLAAEISKPDGLKWIKKNEVHQILENLPPHELWGIGKKLAHKLEALGIITCGQLGRASPSLLRSHFGIIGHRLKAMGLGIDSTPVLTEMARTKSVGHSMTLPRDIADCETIASYILKLSEMVGRRARKHNLVGAVITVTLRYKSFETFSRQKRIHSFTNDTHRIYRTALEILRSIRLKEAVRLIGVSLSSIVDDPGQMYILKEYEKKQNLLRVMDRINDLYGESTLSWASYAALEADAKVISPAWRPSGVHRTET
jgi:DNA polymerase-4